MITEGRLQCKRKEGEKKNVQQNPKAKKIFCKNIFLKTKKDY